MQHFGHFLSTWLLSLCCTHSARQTKKLVCRPDSVLQTKQIFVAISQYDRQNFLHVTRELKQMEKLKLFHIWILPTLSNVKCDTWHVTSDAWHLTWHMTHDMWHVTPDLWQAVNMLFGVVKIWRKRMSEWISDGGVCRTNPGLLITSCCNNIPVW